jgi:hypothetical protein
MTTNQHTPGPWQWFSSDAGPQDEWGCTTPGPIDPRTFKCQGFYANPELIGPGPDDRVLSAGAGEYMPYSKPADALLIAAAPDLLAALRECITDNPGSACYNTGKKTRRLETINALAIAAIAKALGE